MQRDMTSRETRKRKQEGQILVSEAAEPSV